MSTKTPPEPAFAVDVYYREVGKNIAAARGAIGLTQAQLGQAMNLNRVSIAKIEAGTQRHLSHTLIQFALVFGMKTEALLPAQYRNDPKAKVAPQLLPVSAESVEFDNIIEAADRIKRIRRSKAQT